MTLVGYNDNIWVDINGNGIVDNGEKGAFKIANSWGNDDGRFTVAISLTSIQMLVYMAFI